MFVFIGTPLRIIYWFGVQYSDGQCAKLVNNFYMLSPFLKQIIFILYILRFSEALSMHLLIGNDLPQFSSLQMSIYSLMDRSVFGTPEFDEFMDATSCKYAVNILVKAIYFSRLM